MDGTENKEALSYINLVPNACRPSFPVRSLPSFSPSFLPLFPPPFFLLFVKKSPPNQICWWENSWKLPQADGNVLLFLCYGNQTEKGAMEKGTIESELNKAHLANQ